ncbi:MAG: hypothetical protein HOV83_06390 [Catenulispora sp.]|nr:hypothetical protein [Catenulispora sp.]
MRGALWLGVAGAVTAGAVGALVVTVGGGDAAATDPAKLFTRADAADLFAQSSQGTVAEQGDAQGSYPQQWTATGGAEIDYAYQTEGAATAKSEVTQAGFLHARQLENGSVVEFGLLPEGCRLELAHAGDRVSVNDSEPRGDADCGTMMLALAIRIDGRF